MATSPPAPADGGAPATAPTVVVAAPLPGMTLGKFRIESRLGEGGMGVVYRALDERLKRTVALKVLKQGLVNDPQFAERFLREAQAAARVNHPHVVSILEADHLGDTLYLAFEFVPGGDLAQRIKAAGPLPAAEALRILGECAEGLRALHKAGLIHRDIKPGNIFLDGEGHAKLGDLGLARAATGDDRMTMTGVGIGTPSYMSPEQVDGLADIDIRSDIHALGGTLFTMLTGKAPFEGATPFAVTAKVVTAERPRLAQVRPELPPGFDALIQRAMALRREQRFADPDALLAAIRSLESAPAPAAIDGMTIHPPHRPAPAAAGAPPRPRWPLAAGMVALLALAGAAAWVLRPQPPAPAPSVRPAVAAVAVVPAQPVPPATVTAPPAPVAVTPTAPAPPPVAPTPVPPPVVAAPTPVPPPVAVAPVATAPPAAVVATPAPAATIAPAPAAVPDQPGWAQRSGDDAYGRWADLAVDGVVQRLRWIPAGTFTMGSPLGEKLRGDDEVPHPVTLTRGYWLAASECTRGLWRAVMGGAPGNDDLAMDQVRWDDCQRFCAALGGKVPGLRARLPSEAEWEYACRAGSRGPFAGDALDALGWHAGNAGGSGHPVARKQPNAWGLYDMHGNVLEWCGDWLDAYPAGPASDPAGPAGGEERVVRGGSWSLPAAACRSAFRFSCPPASAERGLGFRVLVEGAR
jgi:tRNA A-37 threonylcarbamoyl transferase component Bud32